MFRVINDRKEILSSSSITPVQKMHKCKVIMVHMYHDVSLMRGLILNLIGNQECISLYSSPMAGLLQGN